MKQNSNTTVEKKKTRRRWFRFRLRTMLILVTLLSALLGWVGWELDQRRREKVGIAWIKEMGGLFVDETMDPYDPNPRNWWDKSKDEIFGKFVCSVWIENENMNDLSPFANLKHLKTMTLVDPWLTEKQIRDFKLQHPNCEFYIVETSKEWQWPSMQSPSERQRDAVRVAGRIRNRRPKE